MTIPLYLFLIPYFIFVSIILIFIFINLGHLTNTGTLTLGSMVITLIVFLFIGIVLFATYFALSTVNWAESITVWDNSWISSFSSQSPTK